MNHLFSNDQPGYPSTMLCRLAQTHGYNFVDNVVIADHDVCTHGWPALLQRLTPWSHRNWESSERILVQHFETEFFHGNLGLATHNFVKISRYLDIDPVRFVIVTNHAGSQAWWNRWATHINNQFHVVVSPLTKMMKFPGPWPKITDSPSRHFVSMLRQQRTHRDLLAKFLIKKNLIYQNLISIDFHNSNRKSKDLKHNDIESPLHFLITDPASRINDGWSLDDRLTDLYKHQTSVPRVTNELIFSNSDHWANAPWYREIFADIVSETVFDYPFAFVSEKSLRPLINGRPFLIFGAAGTLSYLHDMGFRTFDHWWDESYDTVKDPNQRFHMVCDLIEMMASWPMSRCANLLRDMRETLLHNQHRMQELMAENFE